MEPIDAGFTAKARRAYEWGRWRRGLEKAVWAAPAIALGALGCSPRLALALAPVLVGLCVVLVWRGGAPGRGVVPGLLAGTLPVLVPLFMHSCALQDIPRACVLGSLGGGLAAGLAVSALAWWQRRSRGELMSAGVVAVLTGALGCGLFGVGGLIGLAAGLVLGAAPGYAWAPRRA